MNMQVLRDTLLLEIKRIKPPTTGKVFYVNNSTGGGGVDAPTASNNAPASSRGQSPDFPFATLDYAIGQCTANTGAIIYVMPGHAENISAASFVTLDVAGITVIGLGIGRNRPTFTWTATAGTIVISAANVRVRNLVFLMNGIDAIVSGIVITGTDCEIMDCEFDLSTATLTCILGILTAATATRLYIHDNFFHAPITITGVTGVVTAAIQHEVGTDFRINNNVIQGKMTQAILNATTILRGEIGGNQLHVYTGTAAITLATATQCHVHNNNMVVASGTAPIVGAAASFNGNAYTTEGNGPTAGTAQAF